VPAAMECEQAVERRTDSHVRISRIIAAEDTVWPAEPEISDMGEPSKDLLASPADTAP